jgi:hypothetical protein
MLKPGGNLAIFHYPSMIKDIDFLIKVKKFELGKAEPLRHGQSYKNLRACRSALVQLNTSKALPNDLAEESMEIAFYTKGPECRKFYANQQRLPTPKLWSADKYDVVTNCWYDKKHRAGFSAKFPWNIGVTSQHGSATAKWVVERMLYCCVRPGDKVYDCFGGGGTVPFLCAQFGIECRSVEIDEAYYDVIRSRLLFKSEEKMRDLAQYSVKLSKKAENESQHRSDLRVGSSLQGSFGDSGEDSTEEKEDQRRLEEANTLS